MENNQQNPLPLLKAISVIINDVRNNLPTLNTMKSQSFYNEMQSI